MKPVPEGLSITHVPMREPSEDEGRTLKFSLLLKIFSYTRNYKGLRNRLMLSVIFRTLQLPFLGAIFGWVINHAIAEKDAHALWLGAGAYLLLALWTSGTFFYRSLWAMELGERVIHDIRGDIFAQLQRMPMEYFDKLKLGRVISRITSDTEAMRVGVNNVFYVSIVQAGGMLIAAGMMLWLDWVLFLITIAISPILFVFSRIFSVKFTLAHRRRQESFSRVTSTVAESVAGIEVTQGSSRSQVNSEVFRRLAFDHSNYNQVAGRVNAVMMPMLELNNLIFIGCLVLAGAWRVDRDIMKVGEVVQYMILADLFFKPVINLGNIYNNAIQAMTGAERVFRFLEVQPAWTEPATARNLEHVKGHITFEKVTFAYLPGKDVLHDIDLVVEPGQRVAIVGHSGCGKTTLIQLLAKFYLPTRGRILFDGHDLNDITAASLHRQMGVVLQHNFLFNGTVADNIRFANPSATDTEIVEAARQLECLDLISSLPDGFQTSVGERGRSLSLGQRQLICFIRALLADPKILMLDEATSSLDTLTEMRLQRSLERLLSSRTSFVVAHRLSTIRSADRILVIDRGRIVEDGRHEALLEKGGAYYNLYREFVRLDAVVS